MSKQNRPNYVSGDDHIIKDLMYCARFLRCNTEGRGSQRRVLFLLREHGPMTQREILEIVGVRAASLSELLSKLEAKGYIKKEKSETDKRNYNVSITDSGLDALEEMNAQHHASMVNLLSGLTPDERGQLSALLSKLHTLWDDLWDDRSDPPPHCMGKKSIPTHK